MQGKIPWDMLSSDEQTLYQRLCRASRQAVAVAGLDLQRASSNGNQKEVMALLAKCSAAQRTHLWLLSRYPEHAH